MTDHGRSKYIQIDNIMFFRRYGEIPGIEMPEFANLRVYLAAGCPDTLCYILSSMLITFFFVGYQRLHFWTRSTSLRVMQK